MKRVSIIVYGEEEVHFVSPIQSDYSLCSFDIMGHDDMIGTEDGATETKKAVNCKDCLCIMRACKSQRLKRQETNNE